MSVGNIRVICRLRPENRVERESGGYCCVDYSPTAIKLRTPGERGKGEEIHSFTFDNVFGPETCQADVFQAAAGPVVTGVLTGYNGTLFAYGQTGSGKTHTMEGPSISDPNLKGIIPRMMDALFLGLINASTATEFSIKVSFLEIYMERIQDLLDESKSNLQVKEDKGRGIYIQDATEIYVGSPEEMMAVMTTGSQNRSIAATRMNERSSRSHSIFIVHIDQKDVDTGTRRSGKLHFVDLAGSEKIGKTNVTGQQLEEAKMINKSLSALGMVINALTERQAFVPYRDSKLTRLLQEALGGNSQTTLVIACSMSSYNDMETLGTLRFGQRAKKIQNKPIVNQERSAKELLVKLEQAEREIQKQAEILNKIQTHIQYKYANHPTLVQEVAGLIDSALQGGMGEAEVPELKHEPAVSAASSTAQSLTILKQHIDIVSQNEALQQLKLEKQELENELTFRCHEEQRLLLQNADLERNYQSQLSENQSNFEEMQTTLEKVLVENQQKSLDLMKIKNAVVRLKADLNLVEKDITELRDAYPGVDILKRSIQETLEVFSEIQRSIATKGLSMSWDQQAFSGTSLHKPHKSLPDLDYPEVSPTKSILAYPETLQTALDEHKAELLSLNTKKYELEQSNQLLESKKEAKKAKIRALKESVEMLKRDLVKAQEAATIAMKQLEAKVRGIEVERSAMNIELEFRDQQILTLQEMLNAQEKTVEILTVDSPKRKVLESEERISELQSERKTVRTKQLYDEIVELRKALDQKEEELQNGKNKYERLERNITTLSQKQTHSQLADRSSPSPMLSTPTDLYPISSKHIVKPIRGGGGDVWSFKKSNQEIELPDPPKKEFPKELVRSKISKIKEKGTKSGIRQMFGGFFSNILH